MSDSHANAGTLVNGGRIVSDTSGFAPFRYGERGPYPGVVRSLSTAEQEALTSYATLAATNRLCWQMYGHSAELDRAGCLLVARVLFAAVKAIDQVRAGMGSVNALIQLRVAGISVVAKAVARDLRRLSLTAAGTTTAVLPQPQLNALTQIEALDTARTVSLTDPTYKNLSYLTALILDRLSFEGD